MAADTPTTDLSTFKIFSEGNELSGEFFKILSVVVSKSVNKIPVARIVMMDGNPSEAKFEASEKPELEPGKEIRIEGGYHNTHTVIFKGVIARMSVKLRPGGESMLVIDCKDKAVKLTVGRKNKYWLDSKDSDAIEDVLGPSGLEKEVDSTSVTHKEMVQYHSTDWDFIVSRAEANGMLVIADDAKIKIKKPEIPGPAEHEIKFGTDVLSIDGMLDAVEQIETVTMKAWNPANQELAEGEGGSTGLTEGGNLSSSALSGKVNSGETAYTHSGMLPDDELQAWSKAQKTKNVLSRIRGTVTLRGKMEIKPLDTLKLAGFGDRFNGKHFISGVRHELSNNAWETTIQFGMSREWFTEDYEVQQKGAAGLLPPVGGLQVGLVTKIHEDPDGEHRIQVRMPLVDKEAEGTWARVACLDAGKERGSFFRPEVGDEVILGFIDDDPRDAVVLGMLNSSKLAAPLTATEKNEEKGFVTRSKIRFIFNDDKKIVTLETPGGKKFVMDEDADKIELEDQHGNKITMDDKGIVIKSYKDMTLEATNNLTAKGVNIELSASSGMKAGGVTAEISASGQAVLKGGIVQIN